MRAYTIFDDFGEEPARLLREAGVDLTVHPAGIPRPDDAQMQQILETYDCVIIGTSQKLHEFMFACIDAPKVIATASVGVDHICVPEGKKNLITIFNTPKANAQSVAEYTIGCAVACVKRLGEARTLYLQGRDNKAMSSKPEDLWGKTIGVVGAGNISKRIMDYAHMMGMDILCWTAHPERHGELADKGICFAGLDELMQVSDVISVNLPYREETRKIISCRQVELMKDNAIFISVSRLATVDAAALFEKAARIRNFYVCLDIDMDTTVMNILPDLPNVMVTPHIAGGTVATRKRMFREVAQAIVDHIRG